MVPRRRLSTGRRHPGDDGGCSRRCFAPWKSPRCGYADRWLRPRNRRQHSRSRSREQTSRRRQPGSRGVGPAAKRHSGWMGPRLLATTNWPPSTHPSLFHPQTPAASPPLPNPHRGLPPAHRRGPHNGRNRTRWWPTTLWKSSRHDVAAVRHGKTSGEDPRRIHAPGGHSPTCGSKTPYCSGLSGNLPLGNGRLRTMVHSTVRQNRPG